MKKTMILLLAAMATMASCSDNDKKDEPQVPEPEPTPQPVPEPEPGLAELIVGDWVYDHLEIGTWETHKYLANGVFYFSNRNAVYNFANENVDGTYTIDGDRITAQVKIAGVSTQMKMLMTDYSRYSFTADFNDGGESNILTYARLLDKADIKAGESYTPDYAALVKDPVTACDSHNVLVATVDDKGVITAGANGRTYVGVATAKATATIEVNVSGNPAIFGDCAFAFGKTIPEIVDALGPRYYQRDDKNGIIYIVDQSPIDITYYITGTEDDTHVVYVQHRLNKSMSSDEIIAWLDATFVRITNDSILGYLTDRTDAAGNPIAIIYDSAKATLTFSPLTPDARGIKSIERAAAAKAGKL